MITLVIIGVLCDAGSTVLFMHTPGMGPGSEVNMWLRSAVLLNPTQSYLLPFQWAPEEACIMFGVAWLFSLAIRHNIRMTEREERDKKWMRFGTVLLMVARATIVLIPLMAGFTNLVCVVLRVL
jgi:hypothetical protein